jgi:hypothetical protein
MDKNGYSSDEEIKKMIARLRILPFILISLFWNLHRIGTTGRMDIIGAIFSLSQTKSLIGLIQQTQGKKPLLGPTLSSVLAGGGLERREQDMGGVIR